MEIQMTNKRRLIYHVAAARPNFMKAAPLLHELEKESDLFDVHLVHTGQHYDYKMNQQFFDQLNIPTPFIDLEVVLDVHANQNSTGDDQV